MSYKHVGYVFARGIPPWQPDYVATHGQGADRIVYCAGPSVPVASLVAAEDDVSTDPFCDTLAVYTAYTVNWRTRD